VILNFSRGRPDTGSQRRSRVRAPVATAAFCVALLGGAWLGGALPQGNSSRITVNAARTNGAATPSTLCADEKPGYPQGCDIPADPAPPAAKDQSFSAIPVPATTGPSPDIPAGTVSSELPPPFSSSDYLTVNGWWNQANGLDYDVFAGSLGGDASQGVVVVCKEPALGTTGSGDGSCAAFPTSRPTGALQIEGASAWTLTLQATSGATYSFDVATESYA